MVQTSSNKHPDRPALSGRLAGDLSLLLLLSRGLRDRILARRRTLFKTKIGSQSTRDNESFLATVLAVCTVGALIVVQAIPEKTLGDYVIGITVTVCLGTLSYLAKMHARSATQRPVNVLAADIWREIEEGKKPKFSLYLRPFKITNKVRMVNEDYSSNLFDMERYDEPASVDFEEIFAEAASLSAPLIALGRPGEAIGAGRIATNDENWKERFARLAALAERIYVVPSSNLGTKWEIEALVANGYLKKSVFLCPPANTNKLNVHRNSNWETGTRNLPIEMPPYAAAGLFFRVDDSGQLLKGFYIQSITLTDVAAAIRKVTKTDLGEDPQASDIVDTTALLPTLTTYEQRNKMHWAKKLMLMVVLGFLANWLVNIWKMLEGN